MVSEQKIARLAGTALLLAALACCSARKTYPDPSPGWHSGDFSVLFGRLQRVPSPAPNTPPTWTLKFGTANDTYLGEVALTPGERMTGYSGGEAVEVRGHPLDQATTDPFNGRWYVVDSIRMWRGHQ